MNKLDEDISKGVKRLRSFINDAKKKHPSKGPQAPYFEILTKGFVDDEAVEVGRRTALKMGSTWERYGSDTVFTFTYFDNGTVVLFLGEYPQFQIKSSKILAPHQRYNPQKNFVYLLCPAGNDSKIRILTSTFTDSWSAGSHHTVRGYRLTPENTFMNWNNPPI